MKGEACPPKLPPARLPKSYGLSAEGFGPQAGGQVNESGLSTKYVYLLRRLSQPSASICLITSNPWGKLWIVTVCGFGVLLDLRLLISSMAYPFRRLTQNLIPYRCQFRPGHGRFLEAMSPWS